MTPLLIIVMVGIGRGTTFVDMIKDFRALALTYRSAPLRVREQVSLNEVTGKQLLHFLKSCTPATDLLAVSTCNRTEIYYCCPHDLSEAVAKGLKVVKQVEEEVLPYFESLEYPRSLQHLFDVAMGLDAQIVGDLQVSGQVKEAYQWSADENTAGPFLHRLMHTVFFTNKRVVTETEFRDGAASLSYAARDLAEDLVAGINEPRVLVIGVGEIGRDVCLNLAHSPLRNVTVMNRTPERARKLADECGFATAGMEELDAQVRAADVVIASVSGDAPLITRAMFDSPIQRHKFFIDLSLPRSIDPSIEQNPGVVLYNLDDLQEKTSQALEKRKAAIPAVRQIVDESIGAFEEWSKEMAVSPVIQKFKNALEAIRQEELARYVKNASREEAERLDELSRALIQKVVKLPALQLKAACKRGDPSSLVEMLQELFDLEKAAKKE